MPVLINRLLRRGFHVRGPEEKHTSPFSSTPAVTAAAATTDKSASSPLLVSKKEDNVEESSSIRPFRPTTAVDRSTTRTRDENKENRVDNYVDVDDADDDADSLLSEPEWRDYWEKPDYGGSLAGYFAHRERLLQRILRPYNDERDNDDDDDQKKSNINTTTTNNIPQYRHEYATATAGSSAANSASSSSFFQQIRRRERAVRLLHYQYVEQQQQSPRTCEEEDADQPEQQQEELMQSLLQPEVSSPETTTAREKPPSSSSFDQHHQDRWRDVWTFEWHSSIPATACLLLHCLTHSALDDLVRSLFFFSSSPGTTTSSLLVLVCAVLALRLTGDVYWWLDDDTYDALRVDFDNRRRLRQQQLQQRRRQQQQIGGDRDDDDDPEIRWSGYVRRRPIVRAMLFMVSYSICFMTAAAVSESLERHWLIYSHHTSTLSPSSSSSFTSSSPPSSSANMGMQLPSVLHDERYGTCPPEDVSFCSSACQDYLQQRDRTTAMQANADLIYTWQRLTFLGYEEFWYASLAHDADDSDDSPSPSVVATNGTRFLYSVTITVVAMVLYWFLVGGKCWEKY